MGTFNAWNAAGDDTKAEAAGFEAAKAALTVERLMQEDMYSQAAARVKEAEKLLTEREKADNDIDKHPARDVIQQLERDISKAETELSAMELAEVKAKKFEMTESIRRLCEIHDLKDRLEALKRGFERFCIERLGMAPSQTSGDLRANLSEANSQMWEADRVTRRNIVQKTKEFYAFGRGY